MNNKIANIVVGFIEDLPWIEKLSGLTQVARVSQSSGDSKVEKRFPISCAMNYDDACKLGTYDELSPDSKYKSVVFFEDDSFSLDEKVGDKLYYESTIRLVAWLNLCKIEDSCGTSGDYVLSIIKALPAMAYNYGVMLGITIDVTSQLQRDVSIFSKYTFNEKQTQYLMYPYDFFALEIRTRFHVKSECIP